jgi:hypothetical protein
MNEHPFNSVDDILMACLVFVLLRTILAYSAAGSQTGCQEVEETGGGKQEHQEGQWID